MVASVAAFGVVVWLTPDDAGDVIAVDDFVGGDPGRYDVDLSMAPDIGDPVPDIEIEGLDGDDVTSADLSGQVTLINFWSSGCAPCVREMPLLEAASTGVASDVTFVGVDVAEGLEPARKMIERTGVSYTQTRDPSGSALRFFGGLNLPHTVVIDADGMVAAVHSGEIDDEEELMALLDEAR